MRDAGAMKLVAGAAVGACAVALSACGVGSCAASLEGTGVGVSYTGFSAGIKLAVQVCVVRTCHESVLTTRKGSETWISGGIDSRVMNGVQAISVTVRDSSHRVVAMDQAVRVHRLEVTEGCTSTIYDAAVRVSPGRVTPATT